ncbi:co-chaperone DjlA [Marinobacter fonticola]|uniref:molecular chaperone DjlA n=1 Tax=Marinobacter fonticola TaxID=2603215 RepID=UPI0011E83229|nr:molecular chaperone DjlA [Marinobacter fonticola]
MSSSAASTSMPARLENVFYELLGELNACGHQASTLLERTRLPGWSRRSLFYLLGYVARADGRVTETDIRFAESLMKSLRLSSRQRRSAIEHFREGKQSESIARRRGLRLRMTRWIIPRPSIQVVLCLCHAAQLHGVPSQARRYRCEDAIDRTGLPVDLMDIVLDSYAQKVWITQPELKAAPTSYEEACKLLGASRNDSFEELKRAYRRRVSESHPDKLGSGLSDKEYALAKERMHRYQLAWELIKRREKVRST